MVILGLFAADGHENVMLAGTKLSNSFTASLRYFNLGTVGFVEGC